MITLSDLLKVPYVDHGRTLAGLDCYGQVFLARAYLLDRPLKGDFSYCHPDDKQTMTDIFCQQLPIFDPVMSPIPPAGAIGCCFKKDVNGHDVLLHVGLAVEVEGQIKVLNTSRKSGAEIMPLRAFKRLSIDVRFYNDSHH